MRSILIVGAGQAGLQLALALQGRGYDVTVMTNRTPDEIRAGRVLSTQCMFAGALAHERAAGVDFWRQLAPEITGLGLSVTAPDGSRAIDWLGRLDGVAQSVDQRVKMPGWLETFAARGGKVVVHAAAVSDLDYFSRAYDLVLVAAGRGELMSMFGRDAARSAYDAPQRALAVAYVHGLAPRPEHPGVRAVRCNLVPGIGELFVMPALTTSGPCDILFWEAVPGGPADVFTRVGDPAEHLRLVLDLMRRHVPWEHARTRGVELTDPGAVLSGRLAPTVRRPIGELPSGGLALGMADVVVANDPVTGQGANNAARCAAIYLERIVARGDRPFDREWMQATFDRYWTAVAPVTRWTNAMLAPPPEHVLGLIGAAGELQPVADRFANGFDDPADFEDWFYDPEPARRYLERVGAAMVPGGVAEQV
ncbi:2-polyprenyl-6-methoxyphenol hydroxylase [Actinacidiphila yanglinensis]|uniref:2-polyprenyl-6-methoxyphenol hydroxylase n=1 Tax=Actinacidiphila yanglinensis TaxID=310779 RepID=A0A1H5VL20_9ACTN|nr:styrene monooxygenase/indole monooxygenase family protein [Actinacidiphila yanglinensis]SEF87538.1 2-polyprenyl-6-methoxyphenol hydroxylase [Actinacidiphila yanglinensis]